MSILIAFINDTAGGRMSKEKEIYRVTVTNFNKHNAQIKKGHKATLISNNFCEDAKLRMVPQSVRWLFLNLILMCGDQRRDTIEITKRQLRDALESSWSIERALDSLQELQLLTYKKIALFSNRIEKKGIEKKRKEVTPTSKRPDVTPTEIFDPTPTQKTWEAYRETYLLRWKQEPTRNATVNGQIKNFVARVGEQDAPEIARFYVGHHKRFYVENCHPVGVMLKDAEALATQWKNNRQITSLDAKNIESMGGMAETYKAIKEGDI